MAKTGRWRSSQAMLLSSTPLPPNRIAGRTTAYDGTPQSASACSTAALPRKYGSGESMLGLVIDTCTIRCTPALTAAENRTLLLATACSWLTDPWANRTQYVLYSVCAPAIDTLSSRWSEKSRGRQSMGAPTGARPG